MDRIFSDKDSLLGCVYSARNLLAFQRNIPPVEVTGCPHPHLEGIQGH